LARADRFPEVVARDTRPMRISIDYELCAGHGQCILAAPDIFDLPDDADQVKVLDFEPCEEHHESVTRAAAMCPAQAISVTD
jgi:ferredoxin